MVSTYSNYLYLNPDEIRQNTSEKLKAFYRNIIDEKKNDFSKLCWVDFNHQAKSKINRSTFSGFWTGSRFNISFSFLAAQRMNVPFTSLCGESVYNYEKRTILESNFTCLQSITTQQTTLCLPKEHGYLSGLHQTELPNDIDKYKTGELCLVEFQQPKVQLDENSLVLVKENEQLKAIKASELDSSVSYVGGIRYVLTRT